MFSLIATMGALITTCDISTRITEFLRIVFFLEDLEERNLFDTLASIVEDASEDENDSKFARRLFPGISSIEHLWPAFQGLINESSGTLPGFAESYLSCIPPTYEAKIVGPWIELRLSDEEYNSLYDFYLSVVYGWHTELPGICDFYLRLDIDELLSERERPWGLFRSKSRRVWIGIAYLAAFTLRLREVWDMASLTRASRITGESEGSMLRRGPRVEDHHVRWNRWPLEVTDAFGLGWNEMDVMIV